jgi:asparagine N-glycosylation enzyme membrane subunit Stt3
MSDLILLSHPVFGVLATLSAVWFFVEALNASEANAKRVRWAALSVAVFMCLAWLAGGYWYTHFYGVDKNLILKGPLPWTHKLVMETKEHLFFVPLVLALFLPIAARERLFANSAARTLGLSVSGLIVLCALAIEGGGALINFGAKAALMHA